jgi:16S rRNA (guanine(966)-N(2))-methyltransferase RsmD
MRVIAGAWKGRRLESPTWEGLRPTSDKLRETLFNILAPRIRGARVLDLFAGTGALGIEAISRGALAVTFVERDPRAAALIGRNLARCGAANGCAIIRAGVARALQTLPSGPAFIPFDLVLLDPPYTRRANSSAEIASLLAAAGRVLAPGGLLVLEHARAVEPPPLAGALVRLRLVTSGDSALTLYGAGGRDG